MLEQRAGVRERVVEEESEEVVAEVVVGLDVAARGEQPGAAVDSRSRFREAAPPRVAFGTGACVAQEKLEQRYEVVRAPFACLVGLAERELGPPRDAIEQAPVVDLHVRLGARAVASLRSVRQPQDECPALDAGKHPLEHGLRDPADARGPDLPAAREVAFDGRHCRTEPFPGSKGGLWWNGTRFSQSFAAFQWMSVVTWSGMIG